MVVNSLSPSFLRIRYSNTVTLVNHFMTLPVAPASEWEGGVEPMLQPQAAAAITLTEFLDDFIPFLQPFFPTATNFSLCDAYWMGSEESDPTWVYASEIGVAGTSGSTTIAYSQATMTCRTKLGGIFKLVLLEGATAVNTKDDYPFSGTNLPNLINYLKGPSCPIWGRDNGYVIGGIRWISKTNDALRKRGLLGT